MLQNNTSQDDLDLSSATNIKITQESENASLNNTSVKRRLEAVEDQDNQEGAEMETDPDQNPQALSIQTVMEMFKSLSKEVHDLKHLAETSQIPQSIEQVKNKCEEAAVLAADNFVKHESTEFKKCKLNTATNSLKIETMTRVLDRMEVSMSDLNQRMETLELNNAKKAVILTGYQTYGDKDEISNQLYTFLDEYLGIGDCTIDECYTIGIAEPKPIVIYFQNQQEKRKVMAAKSQLKGVNDAGNQIYINDYLPPATQEKRRREKDIKNLNKFRGSNDKYDFSYSKGNLMVQSEIYKKKVLPPKPSDLIDIEPEEIGKILKLKIDRTADIAMEKSIFLGYSAVVENHVQIRQLYQKLKLVQPSARHIVCAYYLPGEPEYYNQDYCDDGECGAGRVILELLKRQNMTNRVVFVARKYGGSKLGPDRMNCYIESAVNVLQKTALNPITGQEQKLDLTLETRLSNAFARHYRQFSNVTSEQHVDESQESHQSEASNTAQKRVPTTKFKRGQPNRRRGNQRYNSRSRGGPSRGATDRSLGSRRPMRSHNTAMPSSLPRNPVADPRGSLNLRASPYSTQRMNYPRHQYHQISPHKISPMGHSETRYEQYLQDLEYHHSKKHFNFSNPQYI